MFTLIGSSPKSKPVSTNLELSSRKIPYIELPHEVRKLYPFKSNYFKLSSGYSMHYIDTKEEGAYVSAEEGPPSEREKQDKSGKQDQETILLLHGNPTWSFYYRELIKKLAPYYRVIAPDHIGMGLSDKPEDYPYTLYERIQDIKSLIAHLRLKNFSLVMHDWGGAIGMGVAITMPERIKCLVMLNSAAFCSVDIPKRIFIGKIPFLGNLLIRGLNAFSLAATLMATTKGLSSEVRAGYLFPYNSYRERVAVYKFVKDIPLQASHPSYSKLKEIEEKLKIFTSHPKLILWGEKDFCFHLGFLKRWKEIWGVAANRESNLDTVHADYESVDLEKNNLINNKIRPSEIETYPAAGHYLLEDASPQVEARILKFLREFLPTTF